MRDTSVLRAALGCILFVSLFRLPARPPVSFLQAPIYAGYGNIFVADFNGDGKLDILVSDGTGNGDGILKTGTPVVDKNRLGPSRTITVWADFEEGRFEMTEAPYVTRRNDELARLEEITRANPGITQNASFKQTGGQRYRVVRLLKEGIGTRWTAEKGKFGAMLYRMLDNSLYPKGGTAHSDKGCTAVPTPFGGTEYSPKRVKDSPRPVRSAEATLSAMGFARPARRATGSRTQILAFDSERLVVVQQSLGYAGNGGFSE